MNLSETAFLHPENEGYRLRWFTPKIEVDLCGHATLATAHVLWETNIASTGSAITFHTRSGALKAKRGKDLIWLDFPVKEVKEVDVPIGLGSFIGAEPVWVGRTGATDLLVEVPSAALVRHLEPDMAALSELPVRGVIVTAKGDGHYDFVSRFFAPQSGIPEDPVTGSAHCALAPFWAKRTGKSELVGYQASPRGGEVQVIYNARGQGDDGNRVALGGHAVTVFEGTLKGP